MINPCSAVIIMHFYIVAERAPPLCKKRCTFKSCAIYILSLVYCHLLWAGNDLFRNNSFYLP